LTDSSVAQKISDTAMKKGPSGSTRNSGKTTRRRRKYDEEFKQQALAMVRNGHIPRSVAEHWESARTSSIDGSGHHALYPRQPKMKSRNCVGG
jgi:hypothetical protein